MAKKQNLALGMCEKTFRSNQFGIVLRTFLYTIFQACPWDWDFYGNPMENVPWDGMGQA